MSDSEVLNRVESGDRVTARRETWDVVKVDEERKRVTVESNDVEGCEYIYPAEIDEVVR